MEKRSFFFFVPLIAAALCMAACTEEDDEVEEYPDWQARNEAYFEELTATALADMEANPETTTWRRIKSWSKSDTIAGSNTDYILVEVVESGDADQPTPLYTDTVSVHYKGWLLPSTSYPEGYVFTQSYYGEFDPEVSYPQSIAIGNSSGDALVDGFATALQYMRRGDHWIVYIPHQLGYGSEAQTYIPAYSMLTFEIWFVDFWSPSM